MVQFEEPLGLNDDVLDDDDEEVHASILEESGALAAVSQSNRTLAKARQAVTDTDARQRQRMTQRETVSCGVFHNMLETVQIGMNITVKTSSAMRNARQVMAAQSPWLRHSR